MKSMWIIKVRLVGKDFYIGDHNSLVIDRAKAHKWCYKKEALEQTKLLKRKTVECSVEKDK